MANKEKITNTVTFSKFADGYDCLMGKENMKLEEVHVTCFWIYEMKNRANSFLKF